MASDILHIKDGYFFELPRMFLRSSHESAEKFPSWFVRNDADFQNFEADHIVARLEKIGIDSGTLSGLKERWLKWKKSSDANYGWPIDRYIEKQYTQATSQARTWAAKNSPKAKEPIQAYFAENPVPYIEWFGQIQDSPERLEQWHELQAETNSSAFVKTYTTTQGQQWDVAKISEYNRALDGKIMIPQPFGTLKNAYEPESGFCISRYMVIELIVAILAVVIFGWLARRVRSGEPPTGKGWNMLEAMTQGVRDKIVVPAMGEHDADRFMPFFYSLFFFILGCNLMGMLPFVGAPTAAFGSTAALAIVVFVFGLILGVMTFGVSGYLKNLSPSLGLPWYMSIIIVPFLWLIEAASLLIKHVILAVRLLLNMSAGHLVLLGILGIGISYEAAQLPVWGWSMVAAISVLGTVLLSILELFVAFLQAFVFVFLAALLIGSSIHHH